MGKWLTVVGALGLAAIVVWVLAGGERGSGEAALDTATDAVVDGGAVAPALDPEDADSQREQAPLELAPRAPSGADSAEDRAEPEAVTHPILLVDARGEPLVGVELIADGELPAVVTDVEGRATIAVDPLVVEQTLNGYVLLACGRPLEPSGGESAVLVAAPEVRLSGRVVTDAAEPVPAASLAVDSSNALRGLPLVLDRPRTYVRRSSAVADAQGDFTLGGVAGAATLSLSAKADGFVRRQWPVPTRDEAALELVLARRAAPTAGAPAAGVTVTGRVLDSGGTPVEGASVRWSEMRSPVAPRTDADGQFTFELNERPAPDAFLAATADGLGLVVERGFAALVDDRWPGDPDPVLLQFAAAPPTIRGRLTTAEGEAVHGWVVKPLGGTPVSSMFLSSDSSLEGDLTDTTDADGRFELVGLDQRPYELVAYDSNSGAVDRYPDVLPDAGDLTWVLPADAVTPELRGIVVTTDGSPLAGATVAVAATTTRIVSGGSMVTNNIGAASAVTGADGRFTLTDVPRRFADLSVEAPPGLRVEPPHIDLTDVDPSSELRIEVPFLRPVSIDVTGVDDGAGGMLVVELRDSWGEALTLSNYTSNGSSSRTSLLWASRQYSHVWVSELAVEAVLVEFVDGERREVDRAPLSFGAGGTARVSLAAR